MRTEDMRPPADADPELWRLQMRRSSVVGQHHTLVREVNDRRGGPTDAERERERRLAVLHTRLTNEIQQRQIELRRPPEAARPRVEHRSAPSGPRTAAQIRLANRMRPAQINERVDYGRPGTPVARWARRAQRAARGLSAAPGSGSMTTLSIFRSTG